MIVIKKQASGSDLQEWRPSRRCLITGRVYEHWNDCNQGSSGSCIVVCDAVKQRSRGITTTALAAAAAVLSLTAVPPAGCTSAENLDNCNTTQKNKHSMFTLHLEMSAKGARSTYWNIMRHKECTNHTAQTIGTVWGLLFGQVFFWALLLQGFNMTMKCALLSSLFTFRGKQNNTSVFPLRYFLVNTEGRKFTGSIPLPLGPLNISAVWWDPSAMSRV